MIKTMIELVRKYFDRKFIKPNMYILPCCILENELQYKFIIQGTEIKEYRIIFHDYNIELINSIIISIILNEDISTIYHDSWHNYQLIEFLKQFTFIKLKGLHGQEVLILKDLEDAVSKDNIIDIQINKNINIF